MKQPRIRWYYDTLTPRAAAFPVVLDKAVEERLEELASEVEGYMVANAPWADRTGAARQGLTAEYVDGGLFQHAIVLYHTVDYGIWLEVRWNGQYAIIVPTLEKYGPEVMGGLVNLIGYA